MAQHWALAFNVSLDLIKGHTLAFVEKLSSVSHTFFLIPLIKTNLDFVFYYGVQFSVRSTVVIHSWVSLFIGPLIAVLYWAVFFIRLYKVLGHHWGVASGTVFLKATVGCLATYDGQTSPFVSPLMTQRPNIVL